MFSRISLKLICTVSALLALLILIVVGGPFIAIADWHPLQTIAARCLLITLIATVWLAISLWRIRHQRQANEQVVNQILTATTHSDQVVQEEAETLKANMKKAIELMRRWKPKKFGSAYDLPWYVIIGTPGSGKSTTLLNSGLEFPLRQEMGLDMLQGVGGTRHCDWWFTNKAVIIDTAGRYTTQENPGKIDARGWNTFLALLKKHRPRRPLNGVIVTISVADMLKQTSTERLIHAKHLKQRIQELRNQLGLIFPVYLLLTKADLISGFEETFQHLSQTDYESILGFTFPIDATRQSQYFSDSFAEEFDQLQSRIHDFALSRLQRPATSQSQFSIYQFPKQIELLRSPLWDMVKEIFYPSAYEETPILRGIYLVASPQHGYGLDKISETLANHFQLPKLTAKPITEKAFGIFTKRLFEDVIFSEKNLAAPHARQSSRIGFIRIGAIVCTVSACIGLTLVWQHSVSWQEAHIDQLTSTFESGSIAPDDAIDWQEFNQSLEKLRHISDISPEGPAHLGLDQSASITESAEAAYQRLLRQRFEQALSTLIRREITSNSNNIEYVYETLKTYLMLGDLAHRDNAHIQNWFELQLESQLPGDGQKNLRQQLLQHLQHYLMLEDSLHLEAQIIADARKQLSIMPMAERAYSRLKMTANAARLPSFRLSMLLGSMADKLFERRSGESLQEGINGFYTSNGYQTVFLPEKDNMIQNLLEDTWVYGDDEENYQQLNQTEIENQVEALYFDDYINLWQNFLQDIHLKPYRDIQGAAAISNLLASTSQPLQRLINGIQQNTQLTEAESSSTAEQLADQAVHKLASRKRTLGMVMAATEGFQSTSLATPVDQAFKSINSLEDTWLDNIQQDLKLISRYFSQQADPVAAGLIMPPDRNEYNQAVTRIFTSVKDTGSPELEAILTDFLSNNQRTVSNERITYLNQLWQSAIYQDYQKAIGNKYPFNGRATQEVALEDFSELLGYGGRLDDFFQAHLKDIVDTSQHPWRFTKNIGLRSSSLQVFEQAQAIRSAFFTVDSKQLKIEFSLKPYQLDQRVSQFSLEAGGQKMVYRHGPSRPSAFSWPVDDSVSMTRLVFTPSNSEAPVSLHYEGAWSFLRMLQAFKATQNNTTHILIEADNYQANLELIGSSIRSPFAVSLLEDFKLPRQL